MHNISQQFLTNQYFTYLTLLVVGQLSLLNLITLNREITAKLTCLAFYTCTENTEKKVYKNDKIGFKKSSQYFNSATCLGGILHTAV